MESRAGLGAACCWGAIGGLACASVAVLEPNVLEEGLPLHVAQRLLEGDRLYRDVVFFTGPLPFELLALLFGVFGDHVAVARGAVVALQGLATAAVFGVARRAGCGPYAHLAAALQAASPILLFPLLSIYFPSTLATLLATLAVYAAVRGTGSLGWAFTAGVLAAAVALCKQTVGVALALPLVAGVAAYALPGRRLAAGGAVAAGGLAVAVVTVGAFAARGTAGDLFASLVTMPLTLHESYRTPLPAFWPPGDIGAEAWRSWMYYLPRLSIFALGEDPSTASVRALGLPTQILYASPFVALALTGLLAALGRLPAAVGLAAAAVFASTMGIFPRSDWGHLSMVLPPAWVQLVLVASARRAVEPRREPLRRVAAASLTALVGFASIAAALLYHGLASPRPWDARAPVFPVSESYRSTAVPRVIGYLRARMRPGEALFVARQEPLLYFVTGARNPTRYEGMMQGLRERQEAEVIDALSRLRYVVMSEIDGPATGFYSEELPAVHAYLERHFRIPADFPLDRGQWLVVYERGPDRGEPAIDLFDAARSALYWVKDPLRGTRRYRAERLPTAGARHLRRLFPIPVGPLGGGVDFELAIPERARLEGSLGLNYWGATYFVSVVCEGRTEVLHRTWLPVDPNSQATWRPVEVDLARFAGKRVVLRLEVVPDEQRGRLWIAWWGSPRIVASGEVAFPAASAAAARSEGASTAP